VVRRSHEGLAFLAVFIVALIVISPILRALTPDLRAHISPMAVDLICLVAGGVQAVLWLYLAGVFSRRKRG
jgi:hypothetical protein